MAQRRLADWLADGTLVTDDRPSFTVYRMVATDDAGVERRTTGVIGALELSPPGTDILPHEHTKPKAKSERIALLRSCRANMSQIWGLSVYKGLPDPLPVAPPPLANLVDSDGFRNNLMRADQPTHYSPSSDPPAQPPAD